LAPALGTVDTGLIVSPSSGAITPDFTDAQKEEKPEIAEGSEAIKGVVVVGKREAEAKPWLGLPGPWSYPGLVAHPGGAVTTDYTPAQKAAVANLVAEANRNLAGGKRGRGRAMAWPPWPLVLPRPRGSSWWGCHNRLHAGSEGSRSQPSGRGQQKLGWWQKGSRGRSMGLTAPCRGQCPSGL